MLYTEELYQFLMRVKKIIENYEVNVLKNKFEAIETTNEDNWLVIRAAWPDKTDKPILIPIAYFESDFSDQKILETYIQLCDPERTLLI